MSDGRCLPVGAPSPYHGGSRYGGESGGQRRRGDAAAIASRPTRAMVAPLHRARAAANALTFETMLLGPVTIAGAGAGRIETGYALLTDLLAIARETGDFNRAPP